MTWTVLGDDFYDRRDVVSLGRSARLLHSEALVYCNRLLTDGVLPRGMLRRISDTPQPDADVAELVAVGLWEETTDGWQIEWTDQEQAAEVKKRRKQNRVRDERRRKHNKGDHSMCDPERCWVLRGDTTREPQPDSRVTHGSPSPSPLPSPRRGGGEDRERSARSAGAPHAARPPGGDRRPHQSVKLSDGRIKISRGGQVDR